jgi:fermentation-respiration switch protein FrsA (DUF1100 family)
MIKKSWMVLVPLVAAYLTIVFSYYADQKNMIFVPQKNNSTSPQKFGLTQFEAVHFKNPDGQMLSGWWISHQDGQTHPTLLYCHGSAANLSLLSEVSKLFYDFGFDALIFDYRAYGDSEGSKSDLSEKAVDEDAMSAFQWLKDRGIDEKTILIWGQSLGSAVAAELATKTHPAGLILEGAFPSIYDVCRFRYPWLLIFPSMIHDPFNTALYVTQRTCPLLEIHGESDTLIPFSLGQQVYQAAVEPKQWIPVPNMNHNDFPGLATQYQQQIMDWVTKCEETAKPN